MEDAKTFPQQFALDDINLHSIFLPLSRTIFPEHFNYEMHARVASKRIHGDEEKESNGNQSPERNDSTKILPAFLHFLVLPSLMEKKCSSTPSERWNRSG